MESVRGPSRSPQCCRGAQVPATRISRAPMAPRSAGLSLRPGAAPAARAPEGTSPSCLHGGVVCARASSPWPASPVQENGPFPCGCPIPCALRPGSTSGTVPYTGLRERRRVAENRASLCCHNKGSADIRWLKSDVPLRHQGKGCDNHRGGATFPGLLVWARTVEAPRGDGAGAG